MVSFMGSRMGIQINLFQTRIVDVGIDFGCGNIFMPKQFLNVPKVNPALQKMGSEGMAEFMGRNMLRDPGLENFILNNEKKILSRHWFAQMGEKNEIGHLPTDHQFGTGFGKVEIEGIRGGIADWNNALFLALAKNINETHREVQIF